MSPMPAADTGPPVAVAIVELEAVRVAVEGNDAGAGRGEGERDRSAEAACGSGDQHDPALERRSCHGQGDPSPCDLR